MTATYGESSGIWDRPSDAIQILGEVIGYSKNGLQIGGMDYLDKIFNKG
jgi:hypothetical protein